MLPDLDRRWDHVVSTMQVRIASDSPLIRQMIDVERRYSGEYVIPMPNVEDGDSLPRTTPLLIGDAIDHTSRSGASVMFDVSCPLVRQPGRSVEEQRANASKRRQILAATYHQSKFQLLRRKAFRHFAGYAGYGYDVVPDLKLGGPRIRVLNPLITYPDPKADEDFGDTVDYGVVRAKSASWVRWAYPQTRVEQGGPIAPDGDDDLWDIVEWTDPEVCLVGLLGPRDPDCVSLHDGARPHMLLGAYTNYAEMTPAVMPRRITLGRIASQIAQLTGVVDLMDRLMALDILASEKGIWPDTYIIGDDRGVPSLVGGQWKDGRTGDVNVIRNASGVGQLRTDPGPNSKMTIDRLERNVRISTSLVPQTGGETYGALRTGRGIDALMSAAVDPKVQELHEIDAAYMSTLNQAIFSTWKGWWGDTKVVAFSGWRSDRGEVEFTPNKDIPSIENATHYPIPGQEVSQVTITLGQLLGTRGISMRTFRRMHPWIDDADAEEALINEEEMERFALEAIMAQIQSQQLPLTYLAKLERHRKVELDIFLAIEKADEEIRREQAELEAQLAADQQAGIDPATDPMLQAGLGQPMDVPEPEMVNPELAGRVGQASQLINALQAGM